MNGQESSDFINTGQNNSITSNMIVNGAIGSFDLANSAVTSEKIQNGTIEPVDLSFSLPDGHSLDASDADPIDAVYVDSDGKVGIGIVNPQFTLNLHTNSSSHNYMKFTNDTTGPEHIDGWLVGIDQSENFRIHTWEELGDIAFYTQDTHRMRIENTGEVGIDTADPQKPFDWAGKVAFGSYYPFIGVMNGLYLRKNDGTYDDKPSLYSYLNTTELYSPEGSLYLKTVDGNIGFETGSSPRMIIDSDTGNVGIGNFTSPPESKLHVKGTLKCDNDLNVKGTIRKVLDSGDTFPAAPVAYAQISDDCLIRASSGNVNVVWDSTEEGYAITIEDECPNVYQYVWTITPLVQLSTPCIANFRAHLCTLYVYIFDLSGNRIRAPFSFIMYFTEQYY
ncbi:MAG: hypothetical protein ACMUIP_18250 [bacterium]